jgi:hypothetical protein
LADARVGISYECGKGIAEVKCPEVYRCLNLGLNKFLSDSSTGNSMQLSFPGLLKFEACIHTEFVASNFPSRAVIYKK